MRSEAEAISRAALPEPRALQLTIRCRTQNTVVSYSTCTLYSTVHTLSRVQCEGSTEYAEASCPQLATQKNCERTRSADCLPSSRVEISYNKRDSIRLDSTRLDGDEEEVTDKVERRTGRGSSAARRGAMDVDELIVSTNAVQQYM